MNNGGFTFFFEQPQKADGVPEDFSHKIVDLS